MSQEKAIEVARRFRRERGAEIIREYADFLSIPNVAYDTENIRRNALYIYNAFKRTGARMELLRVPGAPPYVYGVLKTPSATRTLGIYAHYDAQPINHERWTQHPWKPVLYDRAISDGGDPVELPHPGSEIDPEWRLYARSASDDKAPFAALVAALLALREAGIEPTCNLRFLFDGEEERSSPHLEKFVELFGDPYDDVDAWLLFDGPVHQTRRPQIAFGVRGLAAVDLTVYGPERPLHSGHYGNWAPVPGFMLSRLLASMKDEDGRVLIDGFYDSTHELDEAELAAIRAMPVQDNDLRKELGLVQTEGGGDRLVERLMLPSLTVKGMSSGSTGPRARDVIPSFARASLGLRLAVGNDPRHMLSLIEEHIRKQGYHIVRVEPIHEVRLQYPKIARVMLKIGYPAARTPMDHPIVQHIERAVVAAAGEPPIRLPTLGASMPLYLFVNRLGKPAVIVPISNHDCNQHAADENIRLANLWYGIDLYAGLLTMEQGE